MSHDATTPAWSDVAPQRCAGTCRIFNDWKKGRRWLGRVRVLDVAPDLWLGPVIVGLLGLYLRDDRAAWRLRVSDPESMEQLRCERMRLCADYRLRAGRLPRLTLPERRSLSDVALAKLGAEVSDVAWRWRWLWIVMEMECQALSIHTGQCHVREAQKMFRGWPEHKLAEAMRIWFWRQTPSGKKSVRRSNARVQKRKLGEKEAA